MSLVYTGTLEPAQITDHASVAAGEVRDSAVRGITFMFCHYLLNTGIIYYTSILLVRVPSSEMATSETSGLTGNQGGGDGGPPPNIIFSLLWVLALFFLAWPVASIISGIYILLLPFAACIPAVKGVNEVLLKLVNLPGLMGEYIRDGRSCDGITSSA